MVSHWPEVKDPKTKFVFYQVVSAKRKDFDYKIVLNY